MILTPLLDDFLRHIEHERNLSSHTVSQYASDLKHWLADLERNHVPLDTLAKEEAALASAVREQVPGYA